MSSLFYFIREVDLFRVSAICNFMLCAFSSLDHLPGVRKVIEAGKQLVADQKQKSR